jgi:ABC-type glycerol-3-phosphate transport system substrate-binding protein
VAGAIVVAACATTAAAVGSTTKKVSISVASLIPARPPAATKQFNAQVTQFERANPSIDIKPVEYQWTGPSFAAKLAAGTLPTVFEVPFTDAAHARRQRPARRSHLPREGAAVLPEVQQGRPRRRASTRRGGIVALPKGAYAQALHYNRKLFTQAGLDPNKPPKTWAQVVAYARQISREDRARAGYVEMAKDDNTAGLDPHHPHLHARWPDGEGRRHKSGGDLNNPQAVTALNMLKKMRWGDNSMGSNFDYGWSDINQAFAAGNVGMYISGSDVYTNLVQASSVDPSIYGWRRSRSRRTRPPGVLGGGTLVAVKPSAKTPRSARRSSGSTSSTSEPLISKAQADPATRRRSSRTSSRSVSRASDLQQGAVPAREHVDQALHQRAARSDEARSRPASSTSS